MDNNNITEKDSLDIISAMIKKARNSYLDDGFSPILWGSVIALCALLCIIGSNANINISVYNPWWLTFVAGVIQIMYATKRRKSRAVKTWNETATSFVWGAFAITILLGTFIKPYIEMALQAKNYHSIDMFSILLLYGFPTFVTGGIVKFKPMIYGGIICWLMAIATIFINKGAFDDITRYNLIMLVTIIAASSAWLIPGIILRMKFNKAKKIADV